MKHRFIMVSHSRAILALKDHIIRLYSYLLVELTTHQAFSLPPLDLVAFSQPKVPQNISFKFIPLDG